MVFVHGTTVAYDTMPRFSPAIFLDIDWNSCVKFDIRYQGFSYLLGPIL